jgi:hypothetical protein
MPQSRSSKALTEDIRAPFVVGAGLSNTPSTAGPVDNNFAVRGRSATAGNPDIEAWRVDAYDALRVGGEVITPMRKTISVTLPTAGVNEAINQVIAFIPRACRLTGISEVHGVAEGTAATMTAYIEKLTGTQAVGGGVSLMSGTFDMKATALTVQNATLTSNKDASGASYLELAAGDRLGLVFSAVADDLAGIQITLTFAPSGDQLWLPVLLTLNGKMVDQHFFVADQDYIVTGAYAVHGTKLSVAGKLQITKCTGAAQAPSAGTALLTNNSNAGFDLNAANNTAQTGTLTATAASLRLAPGNTLAFNFPATVTALADLVVMVTLQPKERWQTVSFQCAPNASLADAIIFTADRDYEIKSAGAIWTVAAASGNTQLTRDTGTTAGGAGTNLIALDTAAGWQTDGTANTTEVATWTDSRFNFLKAGDRLGIDYSVTTTLEGFCCTVSLKPV